MFLWFVTGAIAGVFLVFREPAIDYRLIGAGALLSDPLDSLAFGGIGAAHSVVVAVGLLLAVMLATIGRRSLRRRLLAVPIGVFAHLVLDGAWVTTSSFWWPLAGGLPARSVPSLQRPWWLTIAMEVVGLMVGIWLWKRFRFDRRQNRSRFQKSGRLDPDLR